MTTAADLATRLEKSLQDETFRLSGAAPESPEVQDLMSSLGLEELVLEKATVTRSGSQVTVTGTSSLFFIDGITATATFAVGETLSVTLLLAFPAEVAIVVPFVELGIGRLSVTVSVSGPPIDVPVASITLGGELTFKGGAVPVTLTPGAGGWTLRAGRIRLPGLSDVVSLFGPGKAEDIARLIPPGLADLGGFSIAELVCVIDPDRWVVSSVSATVETDSEREWTLVPFVVLKKPIALTLGVEFPRVSADEGETNAHQAPSPILTATLMAAMKIGEKLTLPVVVAREGHAWRVGVLSASGFPTVGELIGLISDKKVADSLPAAMTSLGLESSSFEVTIPDQGSVSVFFDARLKDHWKIVDGMVEVEGARLQVHVDGDDVGGFCVGTVRFGEHGEVEVPIAVERSAESSSWTLRLACSSREVPGVSSLTPLPRGVPMPQDLPALDLSEFTVVIGEVPPARTTTVQSIVLKAALKGPWAAPGLDDLDVRAAALDVKVERPTDPHPRVDAALRLTVDVASVDVPIAMRWQSPATTATPSRA